MSDRLIGRLTVSSNVSATLIDKTVTHNGLYEAYDDNADGYKTVDVDIPLMAQKNISQNGTYVATDEDVDGYEKVVVNVSPNVGTKTITENGTYNASADNLDGFSQVVVNVSGVDPSQFVYNWFYNPAKSMVVRQKISDGSFKIWFEHLTIDTIISNQYRWEVPSNMSMFAQRMNGVGASYKGRDSSDNPTSGYLRFEMVNGSYYVYCTQVGSNYRLHGTVDKALIWSTMTGNGNNVDLDTEWSEPTFDPING